MFQDEQRLLIGEFPPKNPKKSRDFIFFQVYEQKAVRFSRGVILPYRM